MKQASSTGNGAGGSHRRRSRLLRSALQLDESPAERHPAAMIRRAAARRCDRRCRSGVVVVAQVREEQDLLESLARLVERPGPLSPELFGAVERLAAETIAPPLAASLQELRRLEPAVVPGAGAH